VTRHLEPLKPNTPPRNFTGHMRISIAATMCVFMTGVINTGTLALLPIVVTEQGWPMSAAQAAIVAMAAAQFGGLLSQWPVGLISDRVPRRLVMALMTLGGGSSRSGTCLVWHAARSYCVLDNPRRLGCWVAVTLRNRCCSRPRPRGFRSNHTANVSLHFHLGSRVCCGADIIRRCCQSWTKHSQPIWIANLAYAGRRIELTYQIRRTAPTA